MIILVDFGSQSAHLISRRVRELGPDVKILTPEETLGFVQKHRAEIDGIIFSGGPSSVYEEGAPHIEKEIFDLQIPILGICYGIQLISYLLGGKVHLAKKREYGPAVLTIHKYNKLLEDLPASFHVWMSHGDEVEAVPHGYTTYATTETIPHAVMADEDRKIYGIQFHPEVIHTQFGEKVFENFLHICGVEVIRKPINQEFVNSIVADVKDSVGDKKAICALSGGVDSSVAAVLVHAAIGDQLTCIYIDSGLMRKGETTMLESTFKEHYHMNIKVVHAKDEFLHALKGITEPEAKRMAIGKTFIEVLEKEAKKIEADFLVQGTIYPDVIESKGTKHAQKIKSHHNVGGLPEHMKLMLLEPLRQFYKDEVRSIGRILGLPDAIVHRQPFPGPGLAVRIIGEVTEYKLDILRRANAIVEEEVNKTEWKDKLWHYFAIFAGIQTTGVRGDARIYGETIAVRAIEAKDAMSANWAYLPHDLLNTISVRIVTEVPEVNRVVYDISNKPPATMEWE